MKTKPTPAPKPAPRRVAAQRIDAAHQFDMSAIAAVAAGASVADYTQIPVLPVQGAVGRNGQGPFTFDIEEVAANVRANGQDIPVFLDHKTGMAVGWIDHTADPTQMPDGTWEWPVQYTEEGARLLGTGSYRYNSPTWLFIQNPAIQGRMAGRIVGVLEVSLTNLPNQYLRSLNSAEQGRIYTVEISDEPTLDHNMTPEQLAALGLSPEATAADGLAAITALKAAADKATEIATAAGAPAEADAATVVEAAANSRVISGALVTKQAYDEVVASRDAAVTSLDTYKVEQAQQSAIAALDAAIADGRYTPGEREDLLEVAILKGAVKFTAMANKATRHAASQSMQTPAVSATPVADAAADYATTALGITATTYQAGKAA